MDFLCSICGEQSQTLSQFVFHIQKNHQINLKQYVENYIEIPLCPYCNTNKLKIPNRTSSQLNRSGNFWIKTCGSKKCNSKMLKEVQKNNYDGEKGLIIREKIRKKRFEYLKKNTGETAWERRQSRKMSYLELWFFDNVINEYKLFEQYDIVNEFPEYPYFIDFAFTNIKLAVELDGKHHFINEKRMQHDKDKDDCLIKNGWTIYRIMYNDNNEGTVKKFLNFLHSMVKNKQMGNKVYRYSEIKNHNKKRNYKKCPVCGKSILISSKRCVRCNMESKRKVERPDKETLEKEVKENSFLALSRKYGVSDNAIRKWCVGYGINYKKSS